MKKQISFIVIVMVISMMFASMAFAAFTQAPQQPPFQPPAQQNPAYVPQVPQQPMPQQSPFDGQWSVFTSDGSGMTYAFSGNQYQQWTIKPSEGTKLSEDGTFQTQGGIIYFYPRAGGQWSLSYQFSPDGNIFSCSIYPPDGSGSVNFFRNTQQPAQPAAQPPVFPAPPQQPGTYPSQPPVIQQQPGMPPAQPQISLDGQWSANFEGKQVVYVFMGDQFQIFFNNQLIAKSPFHIQGNQFFYTSENNNFMDIFQMNPDGRSFTLTGTSGQMAGKTLLLQRMQ